MGTSTLLPHKIHSPLLAAVSSSRSHLETVIERRGVTEGQTSYLGPFGVDETSFDCVVQSGAVLAQSEIGCGAVTVQDAVLRVCGQGLAVQMHSQSVLPLLAGLVTAAHTLQEFCFAQAWGDKGAGARRSVRPFQSRG